MSNPTKTVSQAIAAYKANHSVADMAVADSAADIFAAWSGVYSLAGAGKADFTITGTSNVVNSWQMADLAALPGFSVGSGASLTVQDTAAGLLLSSRVAAVEKATSVVLTGTNVVSAAKATVLAGMPGVTLAPGATLEVSDNAGGLLSGANAAGLAVATSVVLSGDSAVTAAQAETLSGIPGLTKASNAVLHVDDTVANLLDPANAAGLALATYSLVNASATVTSAQLTALKALHGYGTMNGVSVVQGVVLTGSNVFTAAQYNSYNTVKNVTLAPGATVTLDDTFANIENWDPSAPPGYGIPTLTNAIITQAPVVWAQSLQSIPFLTSFSVADTGAALTGSVLNALAGDSKLSGITVTSDGISINYVWYEADKSVLSLLGVGTSVTVTDAPYSNTDHADVLALQADPIVTHFTTNGYDLQGSDYSFMRTSADKFLYGTVVDQLTYNAGDASTYADLPGYLDLSGVPVSAAAAMQADSNVYFAVTDTAENVTTSKVALSTDYSHLYGGITVDGGHALDLSGTTIDGTYTMGGNTAYASGTLGLAAPSLSFIGTPDTIQLSDDGGGTVNYNFGPTSGLLLVTGENSYSATVNLSYATANVDPLEVFDTMVNGQKSIAITLSSDPTHGVVLVNVSNDMSAADIVANQLSEYSQNGVTYATIGQESF